MTTFIPEPSTNPERSAAIMAHAMSWYDAAPMWAVVDEHYTLSGDEDGGVGIECKLCDLGGQPIAYLGWSNPYAAVPEVKDVRSISELLTAAVEHHHARHSQ